MLRRVDYTVVTVPARKKVVGLQCYSSIKWLFCSRARGTMKKYGGE